MSNTKEAFNNLKYKIKKWFFRKEQYEKHFDLHRLFMNILYFIIFIILTLIIYNNIIFFNQYTLFFIRLGSVILLLSTYFTIKYAYYLLKQIKSKHHNLTNGYKALIAILIIIILIVLYNNPDFMIGKIKNTTDKVSLSNFNPLVTSQLIENTNIVSSKDSNINKDLNVFRGLLPQPWSFILFWGILVTIGLVLLSKFVFHGSLPTWLIWVLIILGVIMIFQYKIPYGQVGVNTFGNCDEKGNFQIKNNFLGLGQMGLALQCAEYRSSQCRPMCIENKPTCQCEANLIDLIFHQKGDWILN